MDLIVRILKRKTGKVVAQCVIGFLIKVADGVKSIEKVFSHTPVLGTLAGEDQ
jgi:hypothetical protein